MWTKFWLTLATTTATAFVLRPGVNEAVAAVSAGHPLPDGGDVLFGPVVSLSAYVFMTVISVLKPWGLTRRGRRLRKTARADARRTRPRLTGGDGGRRPRGRAASPHSVRSSRSAISPTNRAGSLGGRPPPPRPGCTAVRRCR